MLVCAGEVIDVIPGIINRHLHHKLRTLPFALLFSVLGFVLKAKVFRKIQDREI